MAEDSASCRRKTLSFPCLEHFFYFNCLCGSFWIDSSSFCFLVCQLHWQTTWKHLHRWGLIGGEEDRQTLTQSCIHSFSRSFNHSSTNPRPLTRCHSNFVTVLSANLTFLPALLRFFKPENFENPETPLSLCCRCVFAGLFSCAWFAPPARDTLSCLWVKCNKFANTI